MTNIPVIRRQNIYILTGLPAFKSYGLWIFSITWDCINSNFVHNTFYTTQLETGKYPFCIKCKYHCIIIASLQKRRWHSEKLHDRICWHTEEMNPDVLDALGLVFTAPGTGQAQGMVCSKGSIPRCWLPGYAGFPSHVALAGCSRHCGYLPESLLPLLHLQHIRRLNRIFFLLKSVDVIPCPCHVTGLEEQSLGQLPHNAGAGMD